MHWTKALHLSKCDDEWDFITYRCLLTSPPLYMVLAQYSSMTELCMCSHGKAHVLCQMSQMNTCQVMSSPLSADGRPQLLKCTETHCAAPVWSCSCSHNSSTEQARYLQGFYYSLVMKPTEVKRDRQDISNRAWFQYASVTEAVTVDGEYQMLGTKCW